MTASHTYVRTLGRFLITHSGRELRIPRSKEKALIAFLAVNAGRSYQRDYLANLFWSTASGTNSKHSLNQALHTINRILPTLLSLKPTSVEIRSGAVDTDLNQLNRYIREGVLLPNISVVGGEFLADLNIRDAIEFDAWKSDFNRQVFFKIDAAAQQELKVLRPIDRITAIQELTTLATISPVVQLPTPTDITSEFDGPSHPVISSPHVNAFFLPFVGRDNQLASLRYYWEQAEDGKPCFVTVRGHAGHGKTRLVDEFINSIGGDKRVLRARCYQSERRIPFGPILEMYAEGVKAYDLQEIEPIWISALQEMIPSLRFNQPAPPELSATASQSRLYEALLRVMTAVANQNPLLVFIDDVQWSDASTQALISFLTHRLKARAMLVVSERVSSQGANSVRPWREWPCIVVEELSQIQLAEAVQQLPKGLTSSIPSIAELDHLTRGHPYMVTEVIRSATREGNPDVDPSNMMSFIGIEPFIASLLSELPADAQRIMAALSVIGRPAPMRLISRVAHVRNMVPGLNLLLDKGLISKAAGKIALRHDLVRESTYKRLGPFTRTELHRRAATTLSANSTYIGETAEHYYRARDRKATLAFGMRASQDAEARYANDESIYFLRLAMRAADTTRPKVRLRYAEQLYRAGRMNEAAQQIRKIIARPIKLSESDFIVWKIRLLEIAYNTGDLTGADLRTELERLRPRLPEIEITTLTHLLFLHATSAFHDGYRKPVEASHRALKNIADKASSPHGFAALAIAVRGHVTVTSASEGDAWAKPLRANLHEIANAELKIKVLSALSAVAYSAGRLVEASKYTDLTLQEIDRVGAMNEWAYTAGNAHMLFVEQGRFTEAMTVYDEIKSRAGGVLDLLATASANASIMFYMNGDFNQAQLTANYGLAQLENRQSTWTDLVLRALIGLSALEAGELSRAATIAAFLKEKVDSLGARLIDLSYVEILIARIDTIKGRRSEAVTRLSTAINDFVDRDTICRLRMELELARMLKMDDRHQARILARKVFELAKAGNAAPIADGADSLLTRL